MRRIFSVITLKSDSSIQWRLTKEVFTSTIVFYCIVSIHLYSASCSAPQSEALQTPRSNGDWPKRYLPVLLYSTVLYLYIYIALLAVHTNQKCFQCERPRKKRAVLKERKEALGSPVNKVDRVEGRSWFQSEGPTIARALV